jgi:4-amino-4-deoxy-L-arabinose transferase-like glycosyltransferase
MAVEHFDEGVYASNLWFGPEAGYQYPMRRLYAPPLLPSLIEWSLIFDRMGGPVSHKVSQFAALVPSLLAGCLTLFVIWRMTREWFGPEAGLATLAIASLSDFHALYCRTALTEALMLLLFVASVWMLKRAFSTGSYAALGLAGLLTGLCWWTKYNGWLPLAVGFGGLTIAFVVDARCRSRFVKLTAFGLGAAAIAFAVWSPYLRELQSYGGYGEVAANHRKYLVGFEGWASSLSQQYANLSHFDGWASCASVGIAVLVFGLSARPDRQQLRKIFALAVGLCAASAWLGSALVMFLLATWVICSALYRRWLNNTAERDRDDLALYFLAAWIGGLLITTPLYHPYPRLALPWLCALWIGAGFAISRLVETSVKPNDEQRGAMRWGAAFVVCIFALLLALPRVAERGAPAWQSRTGWLPISKQIIAEVGNRTEAARGNRDEAIVIVYGEPGLFFQLNVDGTQAYLPIATLSSISKPPRDPSFATYLVIGPHAEQTAGFQEELARQATHLAMIAKYEYVPSDLVLSDQRSLIPPSKTLSLPVAQQVTLYHVVYGQTPE